MIRINAGWLIGIGTMWCIADEALAADLAYGEYLAGECIACHRQDTDGQDTDGQDTDGQNADAAIPPIDALPAPYFIEALREYREGERDHDLMRTVASSLGEAEMEALAAYFEQLEKP